MLFLGGVMVATKVPAGAAFIDAGVEGLLVYFGLTVAEPSPPPISQQTAMSQPPAPTQQPVQQMPAPAVAQPAPVQPDAENTDASQAAPAQPEADPSEYQYQDDGDFFPVEDDGSLGPRQKQSAGTVIKVINFYGDDNQYMRVQIINADGTLGATGVVLRSAVVQGAPLTASALAARNESHSVPAFRSFEHATATPRPEPSSASMPAEQRPSLFDRLLGRAPASDRRIGYTPRAHFGGGGHHR